jgi:hypothetical protein
MHVSRIAIDLEGWYAQDDERRAALMFSPATTAHEAAALTEDAPSDVDRLPALAARHATVGHAQAAGRARLYGRARINRRDFPPSTAAHRAPTSSPCNKRSRTSTPPGRP